MSHNPNHISHDIDISIKKVAYLLDNKPYKFLDKEDKKKLKTALTTCQKSLYDALDISYKAFEPYNKGYAGPEAKHGSCDIFLSSIQVSICWHIVYNFSQERMDIYMHIFAGKNWNDQAVTQTAYVYENAQSAYEIPIAITENRTPINKLGTFTEEIHNIITAIPLVAHPKAQSIKAHNQLAKHLDMSIKQFAVNI